MFELYLPMFIMFAIVALIATGMFAGGQLLGPKNPTVEKMMPYECGIDPIRDARDRFSVRLYIIAMLFLIFEDETILLLPWAITYDRLAVFGLVEMLSFIGILVVGYYYAWRKGALDWA